MSLVVAIPLLLFEAILQSSILNYWRLFGGTVNLVLLTVLLKLVKIRVWKRLRSN